MVGLDGFSGLSSLYHSITGDWHPSRHPFISPLLLHGHWDHIQGDHPNVVSLQGHQECATAPGGTGDSGWGCWG